ncbi:SusC/RagA family TonB-linked outer membrane protein [Lewinella sp. 4G2]|uniref:SusC/RagA family TonB-linked outer membrane protein n=1 Tax=Lewinella sp. 4G2 TaxID=1803372 RepID=UPI0007B4BD26|nr:SusC/RagA family TonB-linked outer membrane protein [Lewinella sp. 4G2]OAV42694.1 SusC/RagA family TonB-linked outer membrane protein [Lewinella sp. 4G2]
MKRFSLLIAAVCLSFSAAFAQTITGTIYDESGESLIGASVLVRGTTSGTVSDIDGKFSLAVPANAETLVVSYTGFSTQTVPIVAGKTDYVITLAENAAQLGEVVVTALGIERRRDEDLSSATLIKSDVLQRSGETGVVQGLAGKTSGINITRNSGDPGAGAYIQIRGQNTILGDASPLIILDGVPISNSNIGGGTAGVVQQSRLNDINPQDIESITVLKGASAAAVYGTGAANGVLVINTKRGRTGGKKFSVNAGVSYGLDNVNREYEKQDQFGQGFPNTFNGSDFDTYGYWVPNTSLSWGDRIADRSGTDVIDDAGATFTGDQTGTVYGTITDKGDQTIYNETNRDQVFQTGNTVDMNVSVNFRGDNSRTYVSFSNLAQEGLLRGNSDYNRSTIRINQDFDLTNKVNIRVNSSYSGVESNRVQTGSNLAGLYLGYLRTSPDFDNTDYSGTYTGTDGLTRPGHRGYRRYLGESAPVYNNPGWTINRQVNPSEVDRFLVAPEVNYQILPNLKFTARYGLDYYTDERRTVFPVNSAGDFSQGGLFRDEITEKTQNLFLILNGNSDITDGFNLDYTFGYNYFDNDYQRLSGSATNLLVPSDEFNLGNAIAANNGSSQFLSRNRKNGVFGVLNSTIGDRLLIELSGRLERTASLPDELFFYPSASLGYKLVDDDTKGLSFAKLRASYGQVGIEPPLYVNRSTFVSTTPGSGGWGDVLDGLNYGGSYARSSIQGNPNLTVERVKEFEIGGDFRFFQDRLSLGATYYNRVTEDALLDIEAPPSTGFATIYRNAAEITNEGIEIDFGYRLFADADKSLRIFGNVSHNENIVTKLPDVSRKILNGFTSTSSALVEGETFGAIYGGTYARNDDGTLALNENGFPFNAPQGVIGDPNPDWRGGLGSEFTFKGLSLSVLFETAQGQDMWNGTYGVLHFFGIAPETANISTAPEDIVNALGETVPAGTQFRGNVIDFGGGPVAADAEWYLGNGGGFGEIDEQFVQDASWTRLREVTLSYALPSTLLDGVGLSNVSVGVTGRNLILWSPFIGADPDTNLTGASRGRGLNYFNNPGSRSVLFNLKFGF